MDRITETHAFDDRIKALHRAAEEVGGSALAETETETARIRDSGDRARLAWALPALSRVLALNDQFDAAEAAAKESLVYFRIHGVPQGQAMALNAQALVGMLRGVPARALELVGRAMALARSAQDAGLVLRITNTLSVGLIDLGRFPEAVDALEDGLAAAAGQHEEVITNRLRSNLACALARWALQEQESGLAEEFWRPRAERAVRLAPIVISEWERQGIPALQVPILDELATAYILLGDVERAHATLDEGERLRRPGTRLYSLAYVHCVRARAWLRAQDPTRALDAIERGRATADARVKSVHMAELSRLESQAHEARGDLPAALKAYKRFHELREFAVLDRVQRLQLEARHDPLTGLANRRRFDEYVAGMLPRVRAGQPLSLILIDLDHFKAINDRHSHLVGDATLRWVALHMEGQCRANDLPARLGGDEFAIVLEAPLPAARQVAERLRIAVATPSAEFPRDVTIQLSIGIAEAVEPCDPQRLFARADAALYDAKRSGRNCARVAP